MILNILIFPTLFLIGIATSYEDFKHGKISNRWLIFGMIWGVIVLGVLAILSFSGIIEIISLDYFGRAIINFIAATLISYLMWKFGAWAAGDAKLFIVFSFLLPLTFYWKSYLPIFPSFVLLVNIFALITLYMVVRAMIFYGENIFKKRKEILKNKTRTGLKKYYDLLYKPGKHWLNKNFRILITIVNLFLIASIIEIFLLRYFLLEISLRSVLPIIFITIIFFKKQLLKIIKQELIFKLIFYINSIAMVLHVFLFDFFSLLEITLNTVVMLTIFIIIFKLIDLITNFYISESITSKKTIPFAFWIFSGVVLTIFLKMSIVSMIINLF